MLVTTALCKSVRKEVKKVGCCALSHQQLSAAPQADEKGIFWNVNMIGKHTTGCIKDIEGNLNHIPHYLFVFLVQTLYANIRHINK